MSTLKVANILDASGGTSNLSVPGAAKAWVNFNGTGTVAIRDDFNVSSLTDNGTGDYTVTFSNALADANYSVIGSGWYNVGGFTGPAPICADSYATSSVSLLQWYMTGTVNQGPIDGLYNNIAITR